MELRICCDASVKLERMTNVMKVNCSVGPYKLEGDTLTGDIIIDGNYIKDVMEKEYAFREAVPFTLVFKDRNYKVLSITVQDFSCQEIINQGIECNFNILVNYLPKSEEEMMPEEPAPEIPAPETPAPEEEPTEIPSEIPTEPVPTAGEPTIQDVEYGDEKVADEVIKQDINKKYDNLLNEILEARAEDNFLEESKVKIQSHESTNDCRNIFNGIKEQYTSYRVYYTSKESDIENICKTEKVSIEKVYRDNNKSDFVNKKRIIIK